jgi:hypothetical protein
VCRRLAERVVTVKTEAQAMMFLAEQTAKMVLMGGL